MQRLLISILLLAGLIGPSAVWSQTYGQFVRAADEAFAAEDWNTAHALYRSALDIDDSDGDLWYRTGRCLQELADDVGAMRAYRAAERRDGPVDLYMHRALLHVRAGDYQDAIDDLTTFENRWSGPGDVLERAVQRKAACFWAVDQEVPDTTVRIDHPGTAINSPYAEFAPTERTNGTLILASFAPVDARLDDPDYTGFLWQAAPEAERTVLDLDSLAPANTFLSNPFAAGDQLVLTVCRETSAGILCDIAVVDEAGLQMLNLAGDSCTATHPMVVSTADGTLLYYATTCDEARGLDIACVRLEADGSVGALVTVPTGVNTPGDEVSPTLRGDTLWFASDFHYGFGGQDIFFSVDGRVANAGRPINTPADDLFFRPVTDTTGWLVSNRDGAETLNGRTCCYDVFRWERRRPRMSVDEEPPVSIATDPGSGTGPGDPMDAVRDLLPVTVFFHNDEPNPRSMDTVTGRSYDAWYRDYMARRGQYIDSFRTQSGRRAALEAFFADSVRRGRAELDTLADRVGEALAAGDSLTLLVKGFCSPLARTDYNDRLAKRRVHSVVLFFEAVQDSAFQDALASGRLRFQRVPFGERRADPGVSDDRTNQRLSVFDVAAARERKAMVVGVE